MPIELLFFNPTLQIKLVCLWGPDRTKLSPSTFYPFHVLLIVPYEKETCFAFIQMLWSDCHLHTSKRYNTTTERWHFLAWLLDAFGVRSSDWLQEFASQRMGPIQSLWKEASSTRYVSVSNVSKKYTRIKFLRRTVSALPPRCKLCTTPQS
jgi:hypothetical protein